MAAEIVGRVLQRAQLSRWLAAAISGQPVVVVMDGPAGVGKSTLVEWLVAAADEQRVAHRVITVPESGDITPDLQLGVAGIDDQLRSGAPQLLVIDDAPLARRNGTPSRRAPGVPARHGVADRPAGTHVSGARRAR